MTLSHPEHSTPQFSIYLEWIAPKPQKAHFFLQYYKGDPGVVSIGLSDGSSNASDTGETGDMTVQFQADDGTLNAIADVLESQGSWASVELTPSSENNRWDDTGELNKAMCTETDKWTDDPRQHLMTLSVSNRSKIAGIPRTLSNDAALWCTVSMPQKAAKTAADAIRSKHTIGYLQ